MFSAKGASVRQLSAVARAQPPSSRLTLTSPVKSPGKGWSWWGSGLGTGQKGWPRPRAGSPNRIRLTGTNLKRAAAPEAKAGIIEVTGFGQGKAALRAGIEVQHPRGGRIGQTGGIQPDRLWQLDPTALDQKGAVSCSTERTRNHSPSRCSSPSITETGKAESETTPLSRKCPAQLSSWASPSGQHLQTAPPLAIAVAATANQALILPPFPLAEGRGRDHAKALRRHRTGTGGELPGPAQLLLLRAVIRGRPGCRRRATHSRSAVPCCHDLPHTGFEQVRRGQAPGCGCSGPRSKPIGSAP